MVGSPTIDGFVAIFHDVNLNSQEDAHCALNRLATCIVDNDFEPFLKRLLSASESSGCRITPLALELILSCKHYLDLVSQALTWFLATECGLLFANWLLSHFPLHPKEFHLSSTAFILAKLSLFLLFECSFERDLLEKLRICRLRVENAPHALIALSEATFPKVSERHAVQDEIDLEYPIIRKSQRQRKVARSSPKSISPLAEKALGVFKFDIPFDSQEAESQITAILEDQQDVLKVFNLFYGLYHVRI